jgi:hypothetical protein
VDLVGKLLELENFSAAAAGAERDGEGDGEGEGSAVAAAAAAATPPPTTLLANALRVRDAGSVVAAAGADAVRNEPDVEGSTEGGSDEEEGVSHGYEELICAVVLRFGRLWVGARAEHAQFEQLLEVTRHETRQLLLAMGSGSAVDVMQRWASEPPPDTIPLLSTLLPPVRKTPLRAISIPKVIILPRQARDKHRQNQGKLKKRFVFRSASRRMRPER